MNPETIPEFIPSDSDIESLARRLLPAIEAYFQSQEGKRDFTQWKEGQRAADQQQPPGERKRDP